jgi:peptidoglycan hydrolase CwlO-like protein
MNSNFGILGFVFAFVSMLGSGAIYVNANNQLNSMKAQAQTTEKELDDLRKRVSAKDEQIKELEKQIQESEKVISDNGQEIKQKRQEVQQWKAQTKKVGICLEGVVQAMVYASNDDAQNTFITLGKIDSECQEAVKVLEDIKTPDQNSI